MKKCPYCAEKIQDEAIICRYCGRELKKSIISISGVETDEPNRQNKSLKRLRILIIAESILSSIACIIIPCVTIYLSFLLSTDTLSEDKDFGQVILWSVAIILMLVFLLSTIGAWFFFNKQRIRPSLILSLLVLFVIFVCSSTPLLLLVNK